MDDDHSAELDQMTSKDPFADFECAPNPHLPNTSLDCCTACSATDSCICSNEAGAGGTS
jgi:hypothetical protein